MLIGFSIKKTIHFGVPLFLAIPIYIYIYLYLYTRVPRHLQRLFGAQWLALGNEKRQALTLAINTVDGRNPAPVEVGSFSHYLRRVLAPSQVVGNGISEPSTVSCMAHSSMENIALFPWRNNYNLYVYMFLKRQLTSFHWMTQACVHVGSEGPKMTRSTKC